MPKTGNHRDVETLLLKLAEFGQFVSAAMVDAAGDAGTVGNLPIMVLATLDLEGPQRPGDLQKRTGLSSGGVTKVIDRLEKKGLVSRDYGGVMGDRRGVLISLTDSGRRRIRAMAGALSEHLPRSAQLVRELDRLIPG